MSTNMDRILPNSDQFDRTAKLLAQLCVNTGGRKKCNTWSDIQTVVRAGLAPEYFAIGEQLTTGRATAISAVGTGSIGIVSVNWDKFLSNIPSVITSTHTLTYDGANWKYDSKNIVLGEWGITFTGTAASGNTITVSVTAIQIVWDVLGFDYDTPSDTSYTHSMTLGCNSILEYGGALAFDAPEFMYYAQNGLAAGTYNFTLNKAAYAGGAQYDGTYQFTLTQPIPVGGGFRHTNPIGGWKSTYAQSDVIGNYITTYNANGTTTIETGVAVSIGSSGTSLGTFTAQNPSLATNPDTNNFTERQAYGSNRWKTSGQRQYLNSNLPSGQWWTKQHNFDTPTGIGMNGFLYGLDPEFKAVIGNVNKRTAKSITDGLGYEDSSEYMWEQSRSEIFDSKENNINEMGNGQVQTSRYPYWQYSASGTGADTTKVKYKGSTARYYWMRSSDYSSAYITRVVGTDGSLYYDSAGRAYGVVPACSVV